MTNLHSLNLADLAATFNRMLEEEDFPQHTRMTKPVHVMEPPRSSRAHPEVEIGVGTSRVRYLPNQKATPIAS